MAQKRIEQKFPVAAPMFALGLKVHPADPKTNVLRSIVNEIVNEVLAGTLLRYTVGCTTAVLSTPPLTAKQTAERIFLR